VAGASGKSIRPGHHIALQSAIKSIRKQPRQPAKYFPDMVALACCWLLRITERKSFNLKMCETAKKELRYSILKVVVTGFI